MTDHAQAIVIGGGIVGCSVLYGLTRAGWTDVTLLERLDLTAGSTWHAAGNVTYFGHYPGISRLYVDSVRIYQQAEQETGQSVSFHSTGGLRLATNQQELDAYRSLAPLFAGLGIGYHVISPDEVAELHPLLDTSNILGAAHTLGDGHMDPSGATLAVAAGARARGATIHQQCPVSGLTQRGDGIWEVTTNQGVMTANTVVLAASFWSRELAAPLGLNLPLYALEHQAVVTEAIPEIEALDFELPTVRDPDAPANVRQESNGLICGVYESAPKFWATDGIPAGFGRELFAPDMDRIEPHLLKVIERLPAFGRAGIKTVVNGPICYTPDGNPLLGPVAGLPGLWLANGFAIGIATGGGAGDYLARWMVEGAAPYAVDGIGLERFDAAMTPDDALATIFDTYTAGYTLHLPEP
jgi:glycine/D-amino acid oxidase-like deaminating enzyme